MYIYVCVCFARRDIITHAASRVVSLSPLHDEIN